MIYGATAALPPALRKPFSARLDRKAVARLKTLMVAWMGAAKLDDATFAERYFSRDADDPVVKRLRSAVQRADLATQHSELASAAGDLAAAIQLIGLDRWSRFLDDAERRANDPATIAAVAKSREPPKPGKDAIRPVYPIENLLGIAATGGAGQAVAPTLRSAAGAILRRVVAKGTSPPAPPTSAEASSEAATNPEDILPNAEEAEIDARKLIDYSLNPAHGKGGHKARVFESAVGMTEADVSDLIAQIKSGITKYAAKEGITDQFGTRFTVDLPITGPKGTAVLRTGWIMPPGRRIPRLVTAYLRRRR